MRLAISVESKKASKMKLSTSVERGGATEM
jgi:hypothetical protein